MADDRREVCHRSSQQMERSLARARLVAAIVLGSLAAACTTAACTTAAPATPAAPSSERPSADPPRAAVVAFFVDSSLPDSLEVVASAQLAMQMAFDAAIADGRLPAGSTVMTLDIAGDVGEAEHLARQAAANPNVVLAVEGPFWTPIQAHRRVLVDAGVPIASLSMLGRAMRSGTFLRTVPSLAVEMARLADDLRRERRVCVLGDHATTYSMAVGVALTTGLEARHVPVASPRGRLDRCSAVVWTGGPDDAASLSERLGPLHPRVPLVLTDLARTRSFLELVEAPVGVTGICGCVDLSTATSEAAAGLLHDYQEAHGLPLGPYGVEGWDLGQELVRLIGDRGTDRAALSAALSGLRAFSGVGGTYTIGSDRERSDPIVYRYRATASRWLPIAP